MTNQYHAPHFDATVDELEALKQLEITASAALPQALHQHLSGRLLERGFVTQQGKDEYAITDTGRALIRRQNN
jgi:predicted transcriptional regulator